MYGPASPSSLTLIGFLVNESIIVPSCLRAISSLLYGIPASVPTLRSASLAMGLCQSHRKTCAKRSGQAPSLEEIWPGTESGRIRITGRPGSLPKLAVVSGEALGVFRHCGRRFKVEHHGLVTRRLGARRAARYHKKMPVRLGPNTVELAVKSW